VMSPRKIQGAIQVIDPDSTAIKKIIKFQYNPETIVRTLTPDWRDGDSLRIAGTPKETINISIELDAVDKLEKADPTTIDLGIYPALSALEILVYPESTAIIQKYQLLADGRTDIVPYYEMPLVLFIWGNKRAIPVQLTALSIIEQEHDSNLNPIRAVVSLSMNVLDYRNFTIKHPGFRFFKAYHQSKERMASYLGG
jgi:hypothetical protein